MQFLDWLDRHFTSNSHFYFYADELGWPMDCFPYGQGDESAPVGTVHTPMSDVQKPAETH